ISTAPSLLTGHVNRISLSEVRSPKSRMRNLPKVKRAPSERGFSVGSAAGCSAVLQAAFVAPAPGRERSITAPSEVITSDGAVIERSLPGAGATNAACKTAEQPPADTTENPRSLGTLFTFGKLRI